MTLARWLLLAFAFRIISAYTHSSWNHPDEWFQTVEFAQYLVKSVFTYSQEVDLHLRNMSWPALLAIPVQLADWISPDAVWLRVFLFQLFTGMLDLGMIWGFWQLSRGWTRGWRNLGLALLVLPYFTIHDSVRPSSEHVSYAATWLALGFIARKEWLAAGFLTVGIAAFRYPCALISAGIFFSLFFHWLKGKDRKPVRIYLAGIFCGVLFFGLPDWVVYGRPWESLWNYLLYNVVTDASSVAFGAEPVSEYWVFLKPRWFTFLAPIGILLVPAGAYGLYLGLRRAEPWACALFPFLLGHLLIAHKEPRFIWPAEALWIFAALYGAIQIYPRFALRVRKYKNPLKAAALLLLALNGVLLLRALWGETWRMNQTYLEVSRHLRGNPQTCAVITVRTFTSVIMPPRVHVGYSPSERNSPSFAELKSRPIIWAETVPACAPDQNLLVHVYRPDPDFEAESCELLSSGVLSAFPKSQWDGLIRRGWASGSWYRCNVSLLEKLGPQRAELPLTNTVPKHRTLRPLSTKTEDLVESAERRCEWLCY